MSSETADPQSDHTQLMVKFVTKNQRFSVPDFPYSILASSNSENLNSLIKNILKEDLSNRAEDDKIASLESIEFDFYVNGTFLETTLHALIKSSEDIKIETVIEIEYTERNPPPEPINTLTVDDWVSSIKGFDKYILLGCYDNMVQLWNTDGKLLTCLNAHTGAVKAVSWCKTGPADDTLCFVSASHDQSLIVWYVSKSKNSIERTEKCVGHTVSVESVDVNTENKKFVSGSWDKMLKLWNLEEEPSIGESSNKKKKSDVNVTVKTPIITLAGHSENISSCRWMDTKSVCTGSWDHSIKLWDVHAGQETRTLKSPSSKIFLALDYSPVTSLIAAGLNDSIVRIYDPKSNEGSLVKISLSSNAGWCSSVCWSPTNQHLLVSGSYDNETKLWDIRNTKSSLYDLLGHEDKVLCVDWSINNLILSGSADNTFKMYRS